MSGSLPCDWKVVYPDDVVTGKRSIVSGPFGSNIGQRFFVETGIPVIRGNNLTLGKKRFVDNGFVFLTEEKAKEFKNCQALAGDIVFTAAGTLGQVGIIPQNAKFPVYIISNKQLRLRPDPTIADPIYLYYWFSSENVRDYIIGLNTGSSVPLITLGKLRSVPINLPPLPIQRKIGSILSLYDDLIENNTRRIRILEDMAQAIYREWFVNFRYPGHEGVRMVESELGPVPEGWEVLPFSQALTLQRGFDLTSADRQEGSVPIYGSIGLSGYHNIAKVKAPGIVTGRSGTLGLVHYVERDFWPHNTALWVKEFKKVTPLFTLFLLRAMDLKQYNGGVAVPTLDRNVVHRVPVIIPERKLIENFEEIVKPLFPLISNLEQKNANLRRTRDLLLPKLISGELDVSELDIEIPSAL